MLDAVIYKGVKLAFYTWNKIQNKKKLLKCKQGFFKF